MKNDFTAGFGEADITPDGRAVELYGQYYRRVSEGVHSRLKATALYLEGGGRKAVMASLDVCGIPEEFCVRVRNKIAAILGNSPRVEVILNATHTHNAPSLAGSAGGWWEPAAGAITPEEYGDFVESKLAEAVNTAYANRKKAGVAGFTGYACAGHPRRALYYGGSAEMYGDTSRSDFMGMEGGQDPGAEFMFFLDGEKKPFGAVANAACPSQVMEATRVVSSDYMGAFREKLKEVFGEDFKTVCQIGAAGCQSPRDLGRHLPSPADFWCAKGVEIISDRLIKTVNEALDSAVENADFDPVFLHDGARINLPLRRVSYAEWMAALREKERLEKIMDAKTAYRDFCEELWENEKTPGYIPPYDDKLHHFVRLKGQKALIERYEIQFESPFVEIDLRCLRLGEAVFATNPFELFLEYGRVIKARSRAGRVFVIQLANGRCGYLPTAPAESRGGYGALVMNGKAGSDGGLKLVDDTLKMSDSLFENG